MTHEKVARELVAGAKRYIDKQLAGIVERIDALEQRTASAEFERAQAAATSALEFARKMARQRARDGDGDVHGWANGTQ